MNSFTEENYLKTIFNLSEKTGEVSVNELSKALDIKMPTVTSMLKKLASKGYLKYTAYRPVELTTSGKKEALLVIRKHRLTEMFLVDKMGFGWEEVHEVAEQIEHIHSPKFFNKMEEMLDYPTVDPHGSPIPDRDGKIQLKNYRTLNSFQEGDKIKILAVTNSDDGFLKYLNSKNLNLGAKLEILEIEEFDKSMNVKFKNNILTLSNKAADKILVEKI